MDLLPNPLLILPAVFGIGLVIFVHELGHFLAARACGVRVLTFSLGFGPKLVAWEKNGTVYQLAAFPLGGYVRMAGEELRDDGLPPLPDELPSKSVGQRFLIYSGGVIMNVLFALAVFPILFTIGVPFTRPTIGALIPGSPAWHAELPQGHEVVAVNGVGILDFGHLASAVALDDSGATELLLRDPETNEETTYSVVPERNDGEGFPTIGVRPAKARGDDGGLVIVVAPDSAAAKAGLTDEDVIMGLVDGTRGATLEQALTFAIEREQTIGLVVSGPGGEREVQLTPEVKPKVTRQTIGIRPLTGRVIASRSSNLTDQLDLREGDIIERIGSRTLFHLSDLFAALHQLTGEVEFHVLRDGRARIQKVVLDAPEAGSELAHDLAIGAQLESSRVSVVPGAPAHQAGLRSGDRFTAINGVEIATWSEISQAVRRAGKHGKDLAIRIERPTGDSSEYLEFSIPAVDRPIVDYGIAYSLDQYVYKSDSFGEAVEVGALSSWRFLQECWLTIKGMLTRRVSPKNIGGIITIGTVSYHVAAAGLAKLFFFLCLLSVNLAFINVLPIPLLDGGHLMFLVIEKIKGSPVSDRIMGYSQMVGVVLILSLMVYVTYNDIVRVFGD